VTFAGRQHRGLLVLAAISDAQALERMLADTDVMGVFADTRPLVADHGASWRSMCSEVPLKASCS
jgi:hypothetical protein